MYYNVDYEICSVIFLLVLAIVYLTKKNNIGLHIRLFQIYWISCFFNTCLDIITCYTIENFQAVPLWINYLLNSIFLAIQFILPVLSASCIYYMVGKSQELNKSVLLLASLPALIGVFMALFSTWTKIIFYFDANGYQHGPLYFYLYINAGLYFIAAIGCTLFSKILHLRQRFLACSIIIVAIIPTFIQFFLPNYMLSGLGTALSVFIMFLTSESIIIYADSLTGTLNRDAFLAYIHAFRNKNTPVQIYAIALDNFKIINEMYGIEGGNQLMRMLADELKSEYTTSQIFRFEGDVFTIVLEEKSESIKELTRINHILNRTWYLEDNEVHLSACIGLVHSIDHADSDSNLLEAIEYAISKAKEQGKGRFFEVNEEATQAMARRIAIEQAMMANIEANTFEVHYQPIFDTAANRFHSLEALARLHVEGYGYVSPEEFILIAENNGTILKIGMLVLEEVCRFIRDYNLKEKGIDFVEVNLSVVQCVQDHIAQDITQMIEKYGISPTMINLEITESAAANSQKMLIRNMARMALSDLTFSLDDYGSGYSNVSYLVDLPFSIVKLDKHIVWAAFKKVTSRKILENTAAMFKDINLKIVAEGIEDANMARTLTQMGIDYLQGYYFSRPIPKEKLIEVLEGPYLEELLEEYII